MKKFVSYSLLTAVAIIALVTLSACSDAPHNYSEPKNAEYHEVYVSDFCVDRDKEPNVRSTSVVVNVRGERGNSYGIITDQDADGLTLPSVKRIIRSDADGFNGPFIGIYVDELSAEDIEHLPEGIKVELTGAKERQEGKTDGLIWISTQYVSWIPTKSN